MRNSERYKYSKGNKKAVGSTSKPPGKSKPWIEVKFTGDIDMKATNPLVHKRVAKGIIGKKDLRKVSEVY